MSKSKHIALPNYYPSNFFAAKGNTETTSVSSYPVPVAGVVLPTLPEESWKVEHQELYRLSYNDEDAEFVNVHDYRKLREFAVNLHAKLNEAIAQRDAAQHNCDILTARYASLSEAVGKPPHSSRSPEHYVALLKERATVAEADLSTERARALQEALDAVRHSGEYELNSSADAKFYEDGLNDGIVSAEQSIIALISK
jgi:hypothetical protein